MMIARSLVSALSALTVLVAVPVGGARAQAPDFEAVGSRLLQAVSAGELSPHQAKEMMATLARVRFEERLDGHHTARATADVPKLDVPEPEVPTPDVPEPEDTPSDVPSPGISRSMVVAFADAGVPREDLDRLCDALAESGVRSEQLPATLQAMLRVIHVTATGEDSIDLTSRIRSYLVEQQGLEVEQFQLAHRLAVRVGKILRGSREAAGTTDRQDSGSDGERRRRVGAAVIRGPITNDVALAKVEAARAAQRQKEAPWGVHLDLERGVQPMSVAEFRRRMVRGVQSGQLTEAQAGEAVRSYRAELDARGIPDLDHEQLKQELDAQVTAGALSKKEAAASFRAVLEKAAASLQRER